MTNQMVLYMPEPTVPTHESGDDEKRLSPSDHVRLEADLIATTSREKLSPAGKTILIYCWSHDLLLDISNEMKSVLNKDIEVLITTESAVAKRLVRSGEVDLILHGPYSSGFMYDFGNEEDRSHPASGAALILLKTSEESSIPWINNPELSMQLTKAMTRLNECSNAIR
jgi:hypothetical protein